LSVRSALISTALSLGLVVTGAAAGPFVDAEAQIGQAYADYRAALFQTNQKDKAATEVAISAFRAKWSVLSKDWRAAVPPQYAEDAKLSATLDAVARITDEAQSAAAKGDLARSHEILEAIRDELGSLRNRNGVVSFSDRMNAYHEAMESAADMAEMVPTAAIEHAAVLAYLAKNIAANPPKGADAQAFESVLKALLGSVSAFQIAARSGEKTAIDATRKALKQPYSRMFLRFG
jgi:hypothetical protein